MRLANTGASSIVLVLLVIHHYTVAGDTAINIASLARLSVSSTTTYKGYDFKKENAVDGIVVNNGTETCGCCYASNNGQTEYFEASFDRPYQIELIKVIGRKDVDRRTHGMLNTNILLDNIPVATTFDNITNTLTVFNTSFTSAVQTIRIQKRSFDLSICELEVFVPGSLMTISSGVNFIQPYEDNVHSLDLPVPVVFYGRKYIKMYITKDGTVSFGHPVLYQPQNWSDPDISPFLNTSFIAPYFFSAGRLNALRDYTGSVTFLELDKNQIGNRNLSQYIHSQVVGSGDFIADWAIVITWSNVTSTNQMDAGPCKGTYTNACPTNTFQMVLLSNGIDSFAIFNYGGMNMPPEKYDQAGFYDGHGSWTNVLASGENIDLLNSLKESGVAGKYVFKISQHTIVRGGCSRNPHSDQLTIFPKYADMFGGRMIDISGPCFSRTNDIRCRFGTRQSWEQHPPETKAVFVSETIVRCMVPRLLVRDRILLSLTLDGTHYQYHASLTIVYPYRMPESERVIAVSSQSPDSSWLSKSPSTLTLTWNGDLLSTDPGAMVDLRLIGYMEKHGRGQYKELAHLGSYIKASDGTHKIHANEHQCENQDCFDYEVGILVVMLRDEYHPSVYKYLSSKILPLGWWVHNAMASKHSPNWPSTLCVDWYNRDRQNTVWLQSIIHCPCSIEQALADFGRWQPDLSCNIANTSPNNCFYHKGAVHCIRAVQPVGKSGNQCCYNRDSQLMFAADTYAGSTPDRSHDWGAAPYGKPGYVPGLSHWLTDVVTFYYCCLWNGYSACDYYMDSRPTKDCVGYTPPFIGSVYGQGHVTPFGGPSQNFRVYGPGDYTLLKAGNTVIQGRFRRNLFPTEHGNTVSSVYSLTAVGIENVGHSDRVELLLRGPDTNNNQQKIDVRVNGEYLEFNDHALAWHDLKGVAVINTDRDRRVQSNFTVILTSDIGLQVVEVANTLQLDVVVPPNTFTNVSGLLGDLDGTIRTPNGTTLNIQHSNKTISGRFEKSWMVHNRSSSLIREFLFANPSGPITLNPPSHTWVCGSLKECNLDYLYTGSEEIARGTRLATERLALLRQYLRPVRSCGLLDVPRAVKSSYGYTVGTTTTIQRCRVGTLSGPTSYTCTATSNQTQAWTPAVTATCGTFTQPPIIG